MSALISNPTVVAIASAMAFGLALVLTQFGLRRLPPLTGAAIAIPASTVMLAALSSFGPTRIDWSAWRTDAAIVFAAVGLLFPATVTVLTFASNRRFGPSVTGALGNLAPVFAVLIAMLWLGEQPVLVQGVGLAVIIAGVTLLIAAPGGAGAGGLGWFLALPLLAALIRGLVQPAVKFGLEDWPDPFAAALIGYLISSTVVLAARAARRDGTPIAGEAAGVAIFAVVGLCNGFAVLTMYIALGGRVVLGIAATVAGVALLLAA